MKRMPQAKNQPLDSLVTVGRWSEEQAWEIDRYLLDDPSLDRLAFEQAMLSDPDLALAVADRVQQLQCLVAACDRSVPPPPSGRLEWNASWRWMGLAAMAASLLLAVSAWWAAPAMRPSLTHSPRTDMAALATKWISLDVEPLAAADESLDSLDVLTVSEVIEESESGSDWMLLAAEGFFADTET